MKKELKKLTTKQIKSYLVDCTSYTKHDIAGYTKKECIQEVITILKTISKQEFRKNTKTIKTYYGIRIQTKTPIIIYCQSVMDHETEGAKSNHIKNSYKMYLEDVEKRKKHLVWEMEVAEIINR